MIKTRDKIKDITILGQMENCLYIFHVTGSHYFGTAKKGSDLDFFVQDCEAVRQWLLNHGFRKLSDGTEYTLDDQTHLVMYQSNIQIQLVEDSDVKKQAQELLFRMDMFRNLTKEYDQAQITLMWNMAFQFAQQGMKDKTGPEE